MVEVEIDGQKVEVPEGSVVMHAATAAGVYVPHFCYHKKLSIAANCRMCLVDIEKAPKPMPACATPVTAGMKVQTKSEKAVKAQQSVMEFLLINHPLDCPICDQGGECQLQDLAVGYGGSASKYSDEKRVVFHKSMGPLISSEEMSRCIHCTRCVRFGQEIAGVMELGMAGRGEHSEIMSFLGESVDSELSGNMIDVCPVGALTSKPFRYSARTWELNRRKSVAPHDSLGSNIVVQIKNNKVMRVVPLENEAVNECWISDRDRFSYEGLNSEQRLQKPMIKQDGHWLEVDWPTAMNYAAHALSTIAADHGGAQISGLAAPTSTVEELFLFKKTLSALGSGNVDSRLRQSDFRLLNNASSAPWLGLPIAALSTVSRVLLIGSFLRKDHPLLAARLRGATKRGAQINTLHAVSDDPLMKITNHATAVPSAWANILIDVIRAICAQSSVAIPAAVATIVNAQTGLIQASAQAMASSMLSGAAGSTKAVLLGNAAVQHSEYSVLAVLAQTIADLSQASCGQIGEASNSVGAYLAGAVPDGSGMNAAQMAAKPTKAYFLMGVDPSLDHGAAAQMTAALEQAQTVVALTTYKSDELLALADCLLPIAPFTETSGTYVNAEGKAQSFNGVVKAAGDCRPAWKVLRVLAQTVGSKDVAFDSSEAVLEVALTGAAERLAKRFESSNIVSASSATSGFERISEVPIYAADALVRRSPSLQLTRDAKAPRVGLNPLDAAKLGLKDGDHVSISQAGASAKTVLTFGVDQGLAQGAVRIASGHTSTAALTAMTGSVTLAKVEKV
jgi:NADH-quinone oxidoreductase subunit G